MLLEVHCKQEFSKEGNWTIVTANWELDDLEAFNRGSYYGIKSYFSRNLFEHNKNK